MKHETKLNNQENEFLVDWLSEHLQIEQEKIDYDTANSSALKHLPTIIEKLSINIILEENLLEDIKKDLLETCEINKNINWDDQETAPSEECLLFIDNLNRYIPKYQNPNTEWQEIKKDIVSKLEDFSSSENPNVFFNDLGITIENLFSNKEEK